MKKDDDSRRRESEHAEADMDGDAVIEQHYLLDAAVEKVWRAISVPALRAHWLPDQELASAEPIHVVPGQEIRYAMRERQPPYLESEVSLQLRPTPDGGTLLTIVHAARVAGVAADAANDGGVYLCAA